MTSDEEVNERERNGQEKQRWTSDGKKYELKEPFQKLRGINTRKAKRDKKNQ